MGNPQGSAKTIAALAGIICSQWRSDVIDKCCCGIESQNVCSSCASLQAAFLRVGHILVNTEFFTKTVADKGKMVLDWRNWLYGLVSGVIGGAATSGATWLGMAGASAAGIKDIHIPNLKELGIMMLFGGLGFAFAYLKQSPLPAKETVITQTTTDTHEEKTTVSQGAISPLTPPPPSATIGQVEQTKP